jgi:hypothetical protein
MPRFRHTALLYFRSGRSNLDRIMCHPDSTVHGFFVAFGKLAKVVLTN